MRLAWSPTSCMQAVMQGHSQLALAQKSRNHGKRRRVEKTPLECVKAGKMMLWRNCQCWTEAAGILTAVDDD